MTRLPPPPRRRRSPAAPPSSRRRRGRLLVALLAAAGLGACDVVTGPEPAPLTAEWVSAASGSGEVTGMPMSLELRQEGTVVTGTGTGVLPSGDAVALAASGTVTGRVVTLVVDSEPTGSFPTTLLVQAMLSEDERRLSGTITQERLTEVRIFQRR